MNNKELQAARKLLMLEVSEAAQYISKKSPRSWQYWESGTRPTPDYVSDEMQTLLEIRAQQIDAITENLSDDLSLPFYASLAQYLEVNPEGNVVSWRISQSVAALFYTEGLARLD